MLNTNLPKVKSKAVTKAPQATSLHCKVTSGNILKMVANKSVIPKVEIKKSNNSQRLAMAGIKWWRLSLIVASNALNSIDTNKRKLIPNTIVKEKKRSFNIFIHERLGGGSTCQITLKQFCSSLNRPTIPPANIIPPNTLAITFVEGFLMLSISLLISKALPCPKVFEI
jgi:hypothetical protein